MDDCWNMPETGSGIAAELDADPKEIEPMVYSDTNHLPEGVVLKARKLTAALSIMNKPPLWPG